MPQEYRLYVVVAVRRGDEVLLSRIGKKTLALASGPVDGNLPQEVAEQLIESLGIKAMRGQLLRVFFKESTATLLYIAATPLTSTCDGAHEFHKFSEVPTARLAPGHETFVALAAKAGPGIWVPTDCAKLA